MAGTGSLFKAVVSRRTFSTTVPNQRTVSVPFFPTEACVRPVLNPRRQHNDGGISRVGPPPSSDFLFPYPPPYASSAFPLIIVTFFC